VRLIDHGASRAASPQDYSLGGTSSGDTITNPEKLSMVSPELGVTRGGWAKLYVRGMATLFPRPALPKDVPETPRPGAGGGEARAAPRVPFPLLVAVRLLRVLVLPGLLARTRRSPSSRGWVVAVLLVAMACLLWGVVSEAWWTVVGVSLPNYVVIPLIVLLRLGIAGGCGLLQLYVTSTASRGRLDPPQTL